MRDRDFRLLFAATALGQLGDRVVFLALPLVALATLHADAFQVGLLTAATTAGSLLVGLPAGAWVDRVRKREVLIGADLARALPSRCSRTRRNRRRRTTSTRRRARRAPSPSSGAPPAAPTRASGRTTRTPTP
ncbi:MFS transporter [Streptomyces sp. NPDC014983]|uniref:MFS transporter n=1 Tax=Streptomyces sp. NPDC014983 TaxID=3364933 RepID=UPI0036F4BE9D